MKLYRLPIIRFGGVLALSFILSGVAVAAVSLSNSLTGFTGDSTMPATQAALGAAGFEFASTAGEVTNDNGTPEDPTDDFVENATVVFDAGGAHFGSLVPGDAGRNYMRTIDSYAFDNYVAEVTVVVDTLATEVVFFGMGSGNIALWGTPDYAGVPSIFIAPEDGNLKSNAMNGISGDWENPAPCTNTDWCSVAAPIVAANPGTHRLQMTLNADTKEWFAAIDVDYAGGPFVADATTLTYPLANMYDDGAFVTMGWPTNPSKIYFGGDDGAIFKDFSVIVSAEGLPGDYNGNGTVDAADYVIWRRNLGTNFQLPNEVADTTPGMVTVEDYAAWRERFGSTAGPGSALGAAVPEPATLLLVLFGAGLATLRSDRESRRFKA